MPYRVRRHEVTQPLDESYRFIPLTRGQNAIVDAADFEWLSQWNWRAAFTKSTGYAVRTDGTMMHALICGTERPDHIDGNGLNNRRSNLRPATVSQNACNKRAKRNSRSGYKGVSFDGSVRRTKPWQAIIMLHGKGRKIGNFSTPEEAAKAYDCEARKLHGEFARLNFP